MRESIVLVALARFSGSPVLGFSVLAFWVLGSRFVPGLENHELRTKNL
jgi:hypothetical protein